jgi:ubiquinone/menaquinone biosynthesis C-methylase UbiE
MRDIHEFSGRGSDPILTEFINRRILTELAITRNDKVVDIGCGDGTLLRLALQQNVASAVGLSAEEDEADRLRASGLNVRQAYSDSIPLPDRCASVVVCNAVLLIVPQDKVPASLREIARIAEPGARIWIGEIPRSREPASLRNFATVPQMLWWLLRNRGPRMFFGMCRRLMTGAQRGPVLKTAQAFWSEPDPFIRMAAEAGLKVEQHFPHRTLDGQQQPSISATRCDYILKKADSSPSMAADSSAVDLLGKDG